jgi:single-stranded DNA-specific DHH superfamily exonuclease
MNAGIDTIITDHHTLSPDNAPYKYNAFVNPQRPDCQYDKFISGATVIYLLCLSVAEKLNKDIEPTVILGACHPAMAYEAFKKSTDVTALIPCNITLRQIKPGIISVETAKPSVLLSLLGIEDLTLMAESADLTLLKMLDQLS